MRTSCQKLIVLSLISILFFIDGLGVSYSSCLSEPTNDLYGDALIPPLELMEPFSSEVSGAPSLGYYDTSEYLLGKVAVGIILMESNGTIDPSTENWTTTRETQVINEIQSGLSLLANQNPNAQINFTYEINLRVPTSFEPINRSSDDRTYWASEALSYLGYPGTYYFTQTRDYINDLRARLHTDWAFAMFVVDSYQDTDGCFTDNRSDNQGKTSAFAYLGGPLLVMTYDNSGYGISNMDYVAAHETCHIFYATDEYNGLIEQSGYLGVYDDEDSTCMMNSANARWLCNNSKAQLGWRDSDCDGVDDILDTNPTLFLEPYSPNPTTETYLRYNGSITDNPYPNQNPRGKHTNITLNYIKAVYYRVDYGPWLNGTALDGAFDEMQEDFYMDIALAEGNHTIEAYGINSVGNPNIDLGIDCVLLGDFIPPTTNADYDGQWHTTNFQINLTATDLGKGVNETYYRINNGSLKAVSVDGQPTISMESAGNTLEFWSVDKAGNIEPKRYLSNIKLDKTPPTGAITVNGGATYTTSPNVNLSLAFNDSISSVSAIRLDNNPILENQEWQAPTSSLSWTLQNIEGNRTIYLQIKDQAGLISSYNCTISLDTNPPTGSIAINNGSPYTNAPTLNLSLFAHDPVSGVSDMRFSNDSTSWSNWKPYSTTEQCTVPLEEGAKTVYAQYRDNAQLVSTCVGSIYLDLTKPFAAIDHNPSVYAGTPLVLSAQRSSDNIGVASYSWIFGDGSTGSGQATTNTYTAPGTYTIEVIVHDVAGNSASATTTVIVLESPTPTANPTATPIPTANPTTQPTQTPTTTPTSILITQTPTPPITTTPSPNALPTETIDTPPITQPSPQPILETYSLFILLVVVAAIAILTTASMLLLRKSQT